MDTSPNEFDHYDSYMIDLKRSYIETLMYEFDLLNDTSYNI